MSNVAYQVHIFSKTVMLLPLEILTMVSTLLAQWYAHGFHARGSWFKVLPGPKPGVSTMCRVTVCRGYSVSQKRHASLLTASDIDLFVSAFERKSLSYLAMMRRKHSRLVIGCFNRVFCVLEVSWMFLFVLRN